MNAESARPLDRTRHITTSISFPEKTSCQTAGAHAHKSPDGAERPLDLEQLVHRCMGRIELAERLLKSFESRFPEDLSRIEECLYGEGSPELPRLVHQLKGATANVSAPELYASVTKMEQALEAKQAEKARTCVAEIHRAWNRYVQFKTTVTLSPNGQGSK